MKVIFISKKSFIYGIIIICLLIMGIVFYNPCRQINTNGYKLRENFPPLVFLPGYLKGPPVSASAGVLIEAKSGSVLYAKNPEFRRAPASTTKMMTAIVALEKGDLRKTIKVSRRAAGTPGSSLWLHAGDTLSLKELLEGMMLQSGNDGSMAVAEGIAGSVEDFVSLMNLKAKEIGALNTNFRNPHGLRAPSHYTTALDLALIARYGLSNPKFATLVKRKSATIRWEGKLKSLEITNTNRLLWYLEGADGVKTGTTNEAGKCLVASATRNGRQLIAVVLNSGNRWGDCTRLLEYGFNEFVSIKVADDSKKVCQIPVRNGAVPWINLYPRTDLITVVKKGDQYLIKPQLILFKKEAIAPVKPGEIWGKIGYRFSGQIIEGVDLINHQPVVKKRKWWFW